MNADGLFFLSIVLFAIGLFVQYWIIRLAVRGGIEDAGRRRLGRLAERQLWEEIEAGRD